MPLYGSFALSPQYGVTWHRFDEDWSDDDSIRGVGWGEGVVCGEWWVHDNVGIMATPGFNVVTLSPPPSHDRVCIKTTPVVFSARTSPHRHPPTHHHFSDELWDVILYVGNKLFCYLEPPFYVPTRFQESVWVSLMVRFSDIWASVSTSIATLPVAFLSLGEVWVPWSWHMSWLTVSLCTVYEGLWSS